MLNGLRTFLCLLLVAAIFCGNVLIGVSEAGQNEVRGHSASFADTAHDHHDGHERTSIGDLANETSPCDGAGCGGGGEADHLCCQMHAHCCTSVGFPPSAIKLAPRSPRVIDTALFDHALPMGTIVYPLLRPPRFVG